LTEGQLPPVQLAPGARSTLFVPVSALAGFGDGQVNATISGLSLPGNLRPAAETVENRRSSGVPGADRQQRRRAAARRKLAGASGKSAGFAPQTLQGQLLLSGKPPLNLARYIRDLKAYPYGCLADRQRSVPVALHQRRAAKALGISGDSDEKRRAAVDIGISPAADAAENGGFALWDKEGPEEYWLTAYAMDFLVRAGEQGYSVPVNAINNGNQRLLRYLQEPGLMTVRYSDDAQASRFAAQAYAALVLARQQKPPRRPARNLEPSRPGAFRPAAAAAGIALKAMGDAPRGEQALKLAMPRRVRIRTAGWAITVARCAMMR
jgi:uncharacterized protein YfaS (alpha-2-macroglobulin family)